MASVVADTHAAAWYLLQSFRLSVTARNRMAAAIAAGDPILVPSISVVELVYLVEKGRIPRPDWEQLQAALEQEDSGFRVVSLDEAIARAVERVPRHQVPDMPDRIIAATALHLGLPLVTRDGQIRATGLDVIW
ncbi:MAG: type II toxin-antitoxin system VapC family toxin [Deltaproteobacteria bacterium]|nr:type II toxin-antitoxin system VapC family toxin [Deltaproteobacteria bacterium]